MQRSRSSIRQPMSRLPTSPIGATQSQLNQPMQQTSVAMPSYRNDMMARKLASDILTTTERPIYTVPSGKRCTITLVSATNTHSGTSHLYVYHTRPSEAASTRNVLYYDLLMPTRSVIQDPGPIYLGPGESIWAKASTANHLALTLYGIEE